jgi:hypothetical protein
VEAWGAADDRHLPAGSVTITGNIFDMTCVGDDKPKPRAAIGVSSTDTIVSDNQIYVRGQADPLVIAIKLSEPAVNVAIHDNLIRQCGVGIQTARVWGTVGEVVDKQTFKCGPGGVPMERRKSHQYRAWNLVWLTKARPNTLSVIDSFDADTLRFKLREPVDLKPGDRFEIFPPSANWNLHDNTITGCLRPLVLDSYGSETSLVKNNLVTRGEVTGVAAAVEVHGRFQFLGNRFYGFDEKDSAVLSLVADPLGRVKQCLQRDNVFDRCSQPVKESQKEPKKATP